MCYVDSKRIAGIVEYWGDKMPMMVMEEAGELIQAISKVERKHDDSAMENLVKEIADMYISLEALRHIYGVSEFSIENAIGDKLNSSY